MSNAVLRFGLDPACCLYSVVCAGTVPEWEKASGPRLLRVYLAAAACALVVQYSVLTCVERSVTFLLVPLSTMEASFHT